MTTPFQDAVDAITGNPRMLNDLGASRPASINEDATAAAVQQRIPESEWKWFGMVGHFICGRWCRFHMATQIGDYLVSTVGMYVHPIHSKGNERAENEYLVENPNGEEIGCDRFYETMVFRAGKPCDHEGCNCGLPDIGEEVDFNAYQTVGEANRGHMAMCHKWAESARAAKEDNDAE